MPVPPRFVGRRTQAPAGAPMEAQQRRCTSGKLRPPCARPARRSRSSPRSPRSGTRARSLRHQGMRASFEPDRVVVELPEVRAEHRGGLGTAAVNGLVLAGLFDSRWGAPWSCSIRGAAAPPCSCR